MELTNTRPAQRDGARTAAIWATPPLRSWPTSTARSIPMASSHASRWAAWAATEMSAPAPSEIDPALSSTGRAPAHARQRRAAGAAPAPTRGHAARAGGPHRPGACWRLTGASTRALWAVVMEAFGPGPTELASHQDWRTRTGALESSAGSRCSRNLGQRSGGQVRWTTFLGPRHPRVLTLTLGWGGLGEDQHPSPGVERRGDVGEDLRGSLAEGGGPLE